MSDGEQFQAKDTTGRAVVKPHRWPTSGGLSESSLSPGDRRLIPRSSLGCKQGEALEDGPKNNGGPVVRPPVW